MGGAPYLQDHVITSFVKGLEQCVHLEELILNDNFIKKIEGLYGVYVSVCLGGWVSL